jgi:phenylpropionate dioxygenase-like ring-hydroxylating dioxygenase large terminal subunit
MSHPTLIPLVDDHRIPNGWYTIASSEDIAEKAILPFTLANIHFVAYRTESGAVHIIEDRCPHVGGSFSTGNVIGENIRCPIHGFTFDTAGTCVATGFNGVSSKSCVHQWPTLEINGLVMVFYHAQGLAPTWQPEQVDWQDWSTQIMLTAEIPASVQLVTEGIADKGHLSTVHGYTDVTMDKEFVTEGAKLTTAYSFTNTGSLPGANAVQRFFSRFFDLQLRVEFDYEAYGLGYSLTVVRIPKYAIEMRNFVNPTPINNTTVKLFYSISIGPITHAEKIHPLMRLLPNSWVKAIMLNALLKGFSYDLDDDIAMWSGMKGLQQPQLCKADGPFNKFRKWANQFYS